MKIIHWMALIVLLSASGLSYAGEAVKVDIVSPLKDVKVVFNMDHAAFDGDKPVGINYMLLLKDRMKELNSTGKIVAIFHGEAAYMTLTDETYDKFRKVSTGNPYKKLIAEMIAGGIEVEECVVSMNNHGWLKSDLMPGVKVNSGAVSRLIHLGQEGYVALHP